MPTFTRLVRFLAQDGKTYYGDAILPHGVSDIAKSTQARVIQGDIFGTHDVTDQIAEIHTLLAPLSSRDVGSVRCLGLNYAKHAKESNLPLPTHPILFHKPPTALSSPHAPIPVPLPAQLPGLDYECELVAIIGRRALNVPPADALAHVLGYAVGNDVSHREWQRRGGGQWALGKCFDGWAPWGPGIVRGEAPWGPGIVRGEALGLGAGGRGLRIGTRVNGEVRQRGETGDMVFGVAELVSRLSQGTTLMPGDVVFTGTPEGVAMGMDPQRWLQDGDVVEVDLEGVGTCTNRVEFVKEKAKL
ncbi:hypothetical protein MMC13_000373 [Lambiella insularis]|nr:hypothetical protein [Lambiella insularis]